MAMPGFPQVLLDEVSRPGWYSDGRPHTNFKYCGTSQGTGKYETPIPR